MPPPIASTARRSWRPEPPGRRAFRLPGRQRTPGHAAPTVWP